MRTFYPNRPARPAKNDRKTLRFAIHTLRLASSSIASTRKTNSHGRLIDSAITQIRATASRYCLQIKQTTNVQTKIVLFQVWHTRRTPAHTHTHKNSEHNRRYGLRTLPKSQHTDRKWRCSAQWIWPSKCSPMQKLIRLACRRRFCR